MSSSSEPLETRRLRVFISANHEDYEAAGRVYEFLLGRGVESFFSKKMLPELANADYRREIDRALDEAEHLVVVASSAANARSHWVEAEWGLFVNEKRSGRKTGNVVTVACGDLEIAELPPSLRYYQVLDLEKDLEQLPGYLAPRNASSELQAVVAPKECMPWIPARRRLRSGLLVMVACAILAALAAWKMWRPEPKSEPRINQIAEVPATPKVPAPRATGQIPAYERSLTMGRKYEGEGFRISSIKEGSAVRDEKIQIAIPVEQGGDYVLLVASDGNCEDVDLWVQSSVGNELITDTRPGLGGMAGAKWRSDYTGEAKAIFHFAKVNGLCFWHARLGKR